MLILPIYLLFCVKIWLNCEALDCFCFAGGVTLQQSLRTTGAENSSMRGVAEVQYVD